MGKKKVGWTPREKERFRDYLLEHKQELVSILYQNIFSASLNYRKKDFFFKKMSKAVKRISAQCKSKFQKQENMIFIKLLGVPEIHYSYFEYLRSQRQYFTTHKIEIENNKVKNPKDFMKWVNSVQFQENKKLRLKIMEEILETGQQVFINDEQKGNIFC